MIYYLKLLKIILLVAVWMFAVQAKSDQNEVVDVHELVKGNSKVIEIELPISTLVVGDPSIADVVLLNSSSFYVLGKSSGSTNVQALDGESNLLKVFELTVGVDTYQLERSLDSALPNASLVARNTGGSVLLSGHVDNQSQRERAMSIASKFSENVIDAIKVRGQKQVYVMVKFVEVSSRSVQNFGSDASLIGSLSTLGSASILNASLDLEATLSALIDNGEARYLAAPTLTAMDGTTASFLAGGEIPIKTSAGASTAEVDAVTFKEYGVKLSFTPKVTPTGTIELALEPEVSQLDQSFDSELGAALSTRKASTTAELRSGESVMIAGLLQSTSSRGAEGLPILGELPILGSLFRNASLKEANTELLIIVTPTLAKPDKSLTDLRNSIGSKELSSGAEFFVDGKLSRSTFSVKDVVAGVGIKGNFGHVIPNSRHQSGGDN